MDEEISLKEILTILWKGKHIILIVTFVVIIVTLLASLVLVKPLFEAQALIDLSPYGIGREELLKIADNRSIIDMIEANDVEEFQELSGNFVLVEKSPFIEVRVTASEPEKALKEAYLISVALLEVAFNYQRESLTEKKNFLERRIIFFESYIAEVYGEDIENIESMDLLRDPIYLRVMEEKGNSIIELQHILFTLSEIDYFNETSILNDQFITLDSSQNPINVNLKLNTIIAGLLGLVLSILFVFIWPNLKSLFHDLKE